MFAVYAHAFNKDRPLDGLVVGERPEPVVPPGWTKVWVKAASLNHHDIWSLRGVGLRSESLPMILGCDAAGYDEDGREVIVHSVIGDESWRGDETLDPARSLLSERHQGTFAECVVVPKRNVLPKPANMSFAEAACLSTAWLTAYRMLFNDSGLRPGDKVLVQGVGGGVATAAIMLARAAGFHVFATSRDEERRGRAIEIGAHEVFSSGQRLPAKMDAVMETVGSATWSHSVRSLRPGGAIVISGATSGGAPENAELTRIFYQQMRVQGSTMGTREELRQLVQFLGLTGLKPLVDIEMPMGSALRGFAAVAEGRVFGKVVLTL